MTNLQFQTLVEQGLQNIAAFVNSSFLPEEMDIHANWSINQFIDELFTPPQSRSLNTRQGQIDISDLSKVLESSQLTIDDLRVLELLLELVPTVVTDTPENKNIINLPTDYNHLVRDYSRITYVCAGANKIDKVENRLTKSEDLGSILKNPFTKTRRESPVSNMTGNTLVVYSRNFTINNVGIVYSKKPIEIDVTNNPNTVMEFPDNVCYKLAKATVVWLAIVSEQNPQKIANLINR